MKKDLINQIIKDTTDKASISDGLFTLGELHSDRLSLYVTIITLLDKVIKAQKSEEFLWISDLNSKGEKIKHHFFVGIKSKPGIENIGAMVPNIVKPYMETLNPKILMQSPDFPPLHKSLITYL